jgi:hypothetical protein
MAGEFDMQDGAASQYRWMKETLDLSPGFWTQDRKIYYYNDPTDGETKVGGYWKQDNNFTLFTVPKSGHFVPADNYFVSQALVDDYYQNLQLGCHHKEKESDCRRVDQMCEAMNNCSGHGECGENGMCMCNFQYKGADCSFFAY